jgi:hypothetical protein
VLIALIVLFQSVASFATDINFGWEYSAADTADITGGGFTLWYGTASAGPFIKMGIKVRAYRKADRALSAWSSEISYQGACP